MEKDEQDIKNTLVCPNIVGGFVTQKKGAIGVVPSLKEINEFLAKHL